MAKMTANRSEQNAPCQRNCLMLLRFMLPPELDQIPGFPWSEDRQRMHANQDMQDLRAFIWQTNYK
jgi:hypothetical protein